MIICRTLIVPLLFQRSFTEFKTWSINVTENQFDISTTGSNRLHLRSSSSRDQPTDISPRIHTHVRRTIVPNNLAWHNDPQQRAVWTVTPDLKPDTFPYGKNGIVTTSSLWHWLRDASPPLQREFYLCFQLFTLQIVCNAVFCNDSFRCDATQDVGHDLWG